MEGIEQIDADIEHLIRSHAKRHGFSDLDCDQVFEEINKLAKRVGADSTALCLIFLDSISGAALPTGEGILHQMKVALNNSGIINAGF